jgi:hypothetical protein
MSHKGQTSMGYGQILGKILEPRLVWSTAAYVQQEPLSPGMPLGAPWRVLNAKRLDIFGRYPHTYADPFLFVRDGILYMFLEIVHKGGHGEIAGYRTSDLREVEDLGILLRTPFHLSFPFVFEDRSYVYMLPESGKAGTLDLYQFDQFPFNLRKVRTLLSGNFVDSHLLKHNETWFLFTTFDDELQLYMADDLLSGNFRPHPANPISADTRISRSAGSVLNLAGRLYRVAQDCSDVYGENASLIEIQVLSPVSYRERIAVQKLFTLNNSWDTHGAHHLNVVEFLGKTVIVTDGKQVDFFVNRFQLVCRALLHKFRRL